MIITQTTKNQIGWWLLQVVKVLTVVATAVDTYHASQAAGYPEFVSVVHVALLDGAFFAFWWLAGESSNARTLAGERVVNLVFACVLFGVMLWIGWDASGPLALGVRAVGVTALTRELIVVVGDWWEHHQAARRARTLDTQARERLIEARMIRFAQTFARWKLQREMIGRVTREMRARLITSHEREPASMRVEKPQARAPQERKQLPQLEQIAHTQASAGAGESGRYEQRRDGAWVWVCDACGARSDAGKRPRAYKSERSAQRGYAGHSTGEEHARNTGILVSNGHKHASTQAADA